MKTRIIKKEGVYYPQRKRGLFRKYWDNFYQEEIGYCLASCSAWPVDEIVCFKTKQAARDFLRINCYKL